MREDFDDQKRQRCEAHLAALAIPHRARKKFSDEVSPNCSRSCGLFPLLHWPECGRPVTCRLLGQRRPWLTPQLRTEPLQTLQPSSRALEGHCAASQVCSDGPAKPRRRPPLLRRLWFAEFRA